MGNIFDRARREEWSDREIEDLIQMAPSSAELSWNSATKRYEAEWQGKRISLTAEEMKNIDPEGARTAGRDFLRVERWSAHAK